MKKRMCRIVFTLCVMIGLIAIFTATVRAEDPTPEYYVTGVPGDYAVGTTFDSGDVGTYTSFAAALDACKSSGTPVIQVGSSESPLSVNRGDGALISATYMGAINIEYYGSQTKGLTVAAGVTVEFRSFALTNSVNPSDTLAYYAVNVSSGGTLSICDRTSIIVAEGTAASNIAYALDNAGTVTMSGNVILSNGNKSNTITNTGSCTIGGNTGDNIMIFSSVPADRGISTSSGQLTIGTGTSVNASTALSINSGTVTISGGTLVSSGNTITNLGMLTISGGRVECNGTGRALSNSYNGTVSGTLSMTGGEVINTNTSGGICRALDNAGTAIISGGTIASGGTETIWTSYRLTLTGDCIVSCTNPSGTAVNSNKNTRPGSEINIGENASISGNIGVVANPASGSMGSGTSTLTITGGSISGGSYAVITWTDTQVSGGRFSATGSNSTAFSCYTAISDTNRTVTITGGEFISNAQSYAYGITNMGSTVNFLGGSVTATLTDSSGRYAYGIQNNSSGTVNLSGGSITAGASDGAPFARMYGFINSNATANIAGGVISSEGSNNTASAVFDEVSISPKGVFISGTPTLKSMSLNIVRLDKRSSDTGALNYFGISFYANTNASVAIQNSYDEASAAYVINTDNYADVKACALPDTGYGVPKWTCDAGRVTILSSISPTDVSTLTDGGNTSVYLSVKQVYTVTVSTDAKGMASASPNAADMGDTVMLSATPKPGYSFTGWTSLSGVTFEDPSSPNTTFVMPEKAVTVTANWTANQYTVTFDPEGGMVSPSTMMVIYASTYGTLPTPTKTGYTFGGWWTGSNGTGVQVLAGTSVAITAAQTLYAKWTISQYTITYNAGGGSVSPTSTKVTYGSDEALVIPVRIGYTFGGWYSGTGGTGSPVTTAAGVPTGTVAGYITSGKWTLTGGKTVYAKWTINQYTVTLSVNGGSVVSPITQDYNTQIISAPSTAKPGYTFAGWFTDEELTEAASFPYTVVADRTLYAKWTINQYTVTFSVNGGSVVSPITQDYNTQIISAPSTAKPGYTFAGWFTDEELTEAASFPYTVVEDRTLYAKWTINQYTVMFSVNGGSVVSPIKQDYSTQIVSAPLTTKPGYTFVGWFTDEELTEAASFPYTVIEDITLYAKWTINQYTVTFSVNGGSAVFPITQDYNTQIASVPLATKPGYTFGGWFTDEELTAEASFPYTVVEDRTLYAKWIAIVTGGNTSPPSPPPARTITVTETSSELFSGSAGEIKAEANMDNAFSDSVEVKVTDMQKDIGSFGLSVGSEVYPFDISLYIKGTNEKTQPTIGYAVTISLPVPDSLLDRKELLYVVHKSDDGTVATIATRLQQINGHWYLVFEATEFSPYALVIRNMGTYNEPAGVPYYLNADGSRVFIGFAANGKYIAPSGVTVFFTHNTKSFEDLSGHWAAGYIGFATEREIFLGTGKNAFSPNAGMTRAMFATVIGRLYERSYGGIEDSGAHAFTDCSYGDYYGKYVDWAAKNDIIGGYGNGRFSPDDLITREQMATILYRFVNFLGFLPEKMDTVLSYPDSDNISNFAKDAALYCQTTGIISGGKGGLFSPKETATRAEVATIIQRFIESVMQAP